MKILYDYQAFATRRTGGVSRYFVELLRQFETTGSCSYEVFAGLHLNEHLSNARPSLQRVRGYLLPAFAGPSRPLSLVNRAAFCGKAALSRADVYHATYFNWLLGPRSAKRVFTVYDMTHERYPEFVLASDPTSQRKRYAVTHADALICISEATRRDLQELWEIPAARIRVIPLGLSRLSPPQSASSTLPYPYFLFVGPRGTYKNFLLVLHALHSLPTREMRVVCFGGGPPTEQETQRIRDLGLADRIHFTNGGDTELARWYAGATALVYPSFNEGFGLPVLEAMAAGCPVLASNRGSLPEVAGDAALFFDPGQVDELVVAMGGIRDDTDLRKRQISRGHRRAALYSWERCARETLDLYRAVCGGEEAG